MKTLFKTIVLSCIIIFTACSKDDDTAPIPDTAITSYSPNHGPKGTIVSLSGVSFGTTTSNVNVNVDEINAEIVSVTNTEIRFKIPPRAFKGEIVVTINGEAYTDFEFEYEISDVQVSTFAGSTQGFQDGALAVAQFNRPNAMVFDSQGNMFAVDRYNHKIRKIAPSGNVSTFAGSANGYVDGVGSNAQFSYPKGIAIDAEDNLYITDAGNYKIRKISTTGSVTTIAGSTIGDANGFEDEAKFKSPEGIAVDANGNIYVTDSGNHKIKRISPNNIVTTLAGSTGGYQDGIGSDAKFTLPGQITLGVDNVLYVADLGSNIGLHGVRKVTLNGEVSTLAGSTEVGYTNGSIEDARFFQLKGIVSDDLGNIYVTDLGNGVIRRISKSGIVTTLAGSSIGFLDGSGTEAQFNTPYHLAIDSNYNLYVADGINYRIRKITQE